MTEIARIPLIETVDPLQHWYGRLQSTDIGDKNFPLERAMRAYSRAEAKRRTQAMAKASPTLNQGMTSRCTMYGLAHALGAAPFTFKGKHLEAVSVPLDGYADCYVWSQNNDEWPGVEPSYYGTSVRAAFEYAKKRGLIDMYVWSRDAQEEKDYLSRAGSAPIILGIDWLEGMDTPKKIGNKYFIEATGAVLGGHAIAELWYDKKLKAYKLHQTWGGKYDPDGEWGDDGVVYLPEADHDFLVYQANGEAGSFTEVRNAA